MQLYHYKYLYIVIEDIFLIFVGGCRNSSPAGKRRVPGTEFSANAAVSETYNNYGGSNNDSASLAVTAATTMAVAICLASIALFAMIFVALQVYTIKNLKNFDIRIYVRLKFKLLNLY